MKEEEEEEREKALSLFVPPVSASYERRQTQTLKL